MAETAELQVRLDLTGNLTSGITKAQRQIDGFGKSVGRIGKGVGQVGAGFARAGLLVGGAAVTGLAGAAKAAIDFEDAFAGVRKTVDEADLAAAGLSFEQLATTFRTMATEIPIAATEFARIGEAAGALGVRAADIDDFTKTVALLGVTTDLSADQAADSLGRIGTILKFTGDDYENFADSLVALGNAGASTESEIIEITKRFAAEGKAAGLATEEIAGLASATASLGFAPERGGTALARVFANMGTNISLANAKGKQFAQTTGRSIADLQAALNRGEGLDIFTDFLQGLKGLSATDANRVLKAAGITNTSDRTIFRAMADNLPFVIEQLGIAADATGALSTEATKRFDTIASKIQLVKNNLVEAAITIGEGMLPAIGRAADELSAFLRQGENRSQLKQLGEDIGEAIDDIDWKQVLDGATQFVGVLRTTLSVTMEILSVLNKLPTEIKAAGLAFLALNKLSGGLIGAGVGNVVGGVAGAAVQGLAARAPGVGKLFAQPVFVTNWPIGGLGGAAGAAGGAGGRGNIVGALGLGGLIVAAAVPIGEAFADALPAELKGEGGRGMSEAQTRITNARLAEIAANTKPGRGKGGSFNTGADNAAAGDPDKRQWRNDNVNKQTTAIEKTRGAIESTGAKTAAKVDAVNTNTISAAVAARNAGLETKTSIAGLGALTGALMGQQMASTMATAFATQGTIRGTGSSNAATITAAIRSNRPVITTIVNVTATHVTKSTTIQGRYGNGSGSRNQDSNGSGTLGNGGR